MNRWKWHETYLLPEQITKIRETGRELLPYRIMVNDLYEVWMYRVRSRGDWPDMIWLSIKQKNKGVVRDWRHLQRIKNDLVGPEHEGVELFPAESRLVDTSNQYHLWVIAEPNIRFPFGYSDRLVCTAEQAAAVGGRQRPFEEEL